MKDLLLNGLPAERRLKGYVWLVAIVLLLVGAKFAGVLPGFVDELPLHLEKSSIDTLGDAGKAQYTELVPADLILDTVFFYIRDDLGFSHVTRFFSKTLKGLINIFDNILRGGNKGFGFSTPPWIALVAIALVLGYSLKGWRLALLSGGTVVYFAVFGLWKYAMETLALLAAAGPISIVHRFAAGDPRLQEERGGAFSITDSERGSDPAASCLSDSGGGLLRYRSPDRGHCHHHFCRTAHGKTYPARSAEGPAEAKPAPTNGFLIPGRDRVTACPLKVVR